MSLSSNMLSPAELFASLQKLLGPAAMLRPNEPLSRRTTLRVGGPADLYVEPGNEEDLRALLRFCQETTTPWMIIGRGSNLLVRDGGIRGVVLGFGKPFSTIQVRGHLMTCAAGARLHDVAYQARNHSLAGLEFMEGIPGNVGGALRMNAGAMGSSIFEVLESARWMNPRGEIEERPASNIPFEYRNCPLFKTHIALSAVFRATDGDRAAIDERMRGCREKRWDSQPMLPSAGCIFKNAQTIPAGRLVQELGLKGARIGGAVVSEVHGNFIVNDRKAAARDVLDLIQRIKEAAWRERGIELQTEVQIVGED